LLALSLHTAVFCNFKVFFSQLLFASQLVKKRVVSKKKLGLARQAG